MDQVAETPAATQLRLDEPTREHLYVLAEGAAALAEFSLSAISIRDGDELEVVAAYGPGVAEAILGRRLPVALLEAEIENADEWGPWRFVPHDRETAEIAGYGYVYESVLTDAPGAWHPRDFLAAPLVDESGELRGVLSVDVPLDGRRPGKVQRELLEKCAVVTRRTVLTALERMELAERVRLAATTREIVRQALGEPTLDLVVEASRSAIVQCFDAFGMWLTAFDAQGGTSTTWYAEGEPAEPAFDQVDVVVAGLAEQCWAEQRVAPFSAADTAGIPRSDADRLLAFLSGIGIGSVLLVPLGVGTQCLGFLVLTRVSDVRTWTDVELDAALDIGHDLGRAVANARQVDQLRRIDTYRTQMVNTLGHELRNPIFTASANLEMLGLADLDPADHTSLTAASRAVARLESVVDDLLTMARIADPDRAFEPVPVDLHDVLAEVGEDCGPVAASKSVAYAIHAPAGPVVVPGNRDELLRLLCNLSSNAVKYTDAGGRVDLRVVRRDDDVVVTVADTGIGISEDDQRTLFREFHRSTNPAALERPGTGLGLAIVERIVQRHSGTLDLSSTLGVGTTLTVRLPAADAAVA
ncbi:signal transduction histidine kinase [Nocardioides cavernae]|uniref:histidine kinase n=1 Tax=Nocardioides cavernae TaxID=1921566 RepID=A0A7Y9H4Q4_9ACTN|nr:GAF domain-containing sensor histidine kinase [Nocardioides cavernae]NYE37875.1 signal transduction histidine kinase [Nocardioides cavernae]